MDIVRRLVSEAPDFTDFRDDKPTLLVAWWCTFYAISVIAIRIFGRYVRAEKLFMEDGIMMTAMIPLLIRMAFVHIVLLYGTNNTKTEGLSTIQIRRRELGSQMVLASRIFYAAYLWAIKYSISEFLRTLTESVWRASHARLLRYLQYFLAFTFLGTVLADLTACQPFTHYWQVVPDPGPNCRAGYAPLLTIGVLNIVTNLCLIVFPIPMILKSRIPGKQKFTILLRLALPSLSIILTLYALPRILSSGGSQRLRTNFASFEILLATFTSNAVVLASLLQDRGYKKTKFDKTAYAFDKRSSDEDKKLGLAGRGLATRDGQRRPSRWGSDEDLMDVKDIGLEVLDLGSGDKKDEGPTPLQAAKFGDIRVEETWEIRVDKP